MGRGLRPRARQPGHDHPHAVRVLARAWAYVSWRCWQGGVACDPDRHIGMQKLIPVSDSVTGPEEAALAAVS